MKHILLTFIATLFFSLSTQAQDVSINHAGIKLNANFEKTETGTTGPVILMTHGTLAHNKMEIMSTLQKMLKDQGISSLAINLGLGINNRQGFYDCATPHTHRHTDALDEIGVWLNWLEKQGVKNVVLLGHSRGGNQTAWFAAERDRDLISKVILMAPATWSMDAAKQSYKTSYNKDLDPLLQQARKLAAAGKGAQSIEHIDFIYCKDTTATADAVVSYYDNNPRMDSIYLLDKIKKPLLVIAATEDTVVKNLDTLLPPLAEKQGFQLKVIEGADHFFLDLYTDEAVEHIVSFVNE
jgi:pimeloyl-ACP methyl ester carboxylesterase